MTTRVARAPPKENLTFLLRPRPDAPFQRRGSLVERREVLRAARRRRDERPTKVFYRSGSFRVSFHARGSSRSSSLSPPLSDRRNIATDGDAAGGSCAPASSAEVWPTSCATARAAAGTSRGGARTGYQATAAMDVQQTLEQHVGEGEAGVAERDGQDVGGHRDAPLGDSKHVRVVSPGSKGMPSRETPAAPAASATRAISALAAAFISTAFSPECNMNPNHVASTKRYTCTTSDTKLTYVYGSCDMR